MDTAIGYFQQAADFRAARDAGKLVAPATDPGQMGQIITNSTVNGTLQAVFALLVLVVVANAALICVRTLRAGRGAWVPTTEQPRVESALVDA